MTFVFDENFPQELPVALELFDYPAIHVLALYARGIPDTELFADLGRKGLIWVSHDKGVRRKPHERLALMEAGIGAFIFTGRAQKTARQMLIFAFQHMDEMVGLADRTKAPYIWGISDRGKFERLG